jgi:hypothetical protein
MIAPHHAQLGHFVVSPATKRPNFAERDVSGDVGRALTHGTIETCATPLLQQGGCSS